MKKIHLLSGLSQGSCINRFISNKKAFLKKGFFISNKSMTAMVPKGRIEKLT